MEVSRSAGFRFTVFGAWIAILFLTLPLLVVVPVSFTPHRYLSLPGPEWSLRHYATLLSDPAWLRSVRDSVIVACGSSALAVVLGALVAIGCWRISTRLSEFVRMLMLAPMIVPTIVHALGFYQGWVQFGLIDTYAGLILAHAMKGTPYVVISVSAALANVDVRLEQAARNLGATMTQTLRMVLIPAARPGILAGAVFAFALSWDELVVNLFITSRHVYTLPRKIWDGIQDNIDPAVAAVATLLIATTVLAMVLRTTLSHRSGRRRQREARQGRASPQSP
jgi:putative spermidine/putrescine transport system permease protein